MRHAVKEAAVETVENTMPVERVSVIVPMLNEAAHVEDFVSDVAAQDYGGAVELIVADGGSTDGSPELLRRAAARHGLTVVELQNDAGWVSQGLNRCIEHAAGDLLVRLDCHSRYPPEYLRLTVAAAVETGADVVGGVIVAEGESPVERAVAAAMDNPFGGIGFYRVLSPEGGLSRRLAAAFGLGRAGTGEGGGRVETDTATFGAFRPAAFVRAGLFDEELRRNQDDELNLRIRRAGGRVVLDPAIRVFYRPRGSFTAVFRQYYEYGYWKVAVMAKHGRPPGPRSLVPATFVGSAGSLLLLAPASSTARRLLLAELGLYGALAVAAAASSARRRGEPAALVPVTAAVFPAFHVGYGTGMLAGAARLVAATIAGRRPRF
jgi:succinoglycan biosynthesis protein ExoA